jgi:hypothetical protein
VIDVSHSEEFIVNSSPCSTLRDNNGAPKEERRPPKRQKLPTPSVRTYETVGVGWAGKKGASSALRKERNHEKGI